MDFAQSLRLIAPEFILSVGGLVLLLAAAWMGDKASRAISIASVAVLAAAAAFTASVLGSGAMGADTQAFFGQMRADRMGERAAEQPQPDQRPGQGPPPGVQPTLWHQPVGAS